MTLLLAAFSSADTWTTVAQISGVATLTFIGALWIGGIVWVSNDIRRRTTDPTLRWLSVAAAAVLFVPGIILYLAMRPAETLADAAERRWDMEVLTRQVSDSPRCPACDRRLRDDFVRCPYCAAQLGANCSSCSRFNAATWVVCPYCGVSHTPPAVAQPQVAATSRRRAATAAPISIMTANGQHPGR